MVGAFLQITKDDELVENMFAISGEKKCIVPIDAVSAPKEHSNVANVPRLVI